MRARRLWLGLAVVGVIAALGALGFSFVASSFSCSWDTSYCATGARKEYRGRLFDYQGRPAPPTQLRFSGSAYDDSHDAKLRFQTDDGGRFCVVADEGSTTSFVTVEGQTFASDLIVVSTAPVDPRLEDQAVRDELRDDRVQGLDRLPFMTVEPLVTQLAEPRGTVDPLGAHPAVELWQPALDATSECQELPSPRWYRIDTLRSSWQFAVLMTTPAFTILLAVVGMLLWTGARAVRSPAGTRRAELILQASCVAALATVALTYAIWVRL